jgi:vacuolar-type H+-ATPase subunit D/Vma8
MANHVRQQIRDAAVTLLTGLSITGSRVYKTRMQRLESTDLPCLLVNTDSEQIEAQTIVFNSLLERQLNLSVRILVQNSTTFDDVVDAVIKDIEIAINASETSNTLNGLAEKIEMKNIDVSVDATGEQPIAEATLTFLVTYYTLANAPDSSI